MSARPEPVKVDRGSGARSRADAAITGTLNAEDALLRSSPEEILGALVRGEVDALVVSDGQDSRVVSLQGAEHTYSVILESVGEGACTFAEGGTILYANSRLAEYTRGLADELPRHGRVGVPGNRSLAAQ
jgi:PAS domain-containing protein